MQVIVVAVVASVVAAVAAAADWVWASQLLLKVLMASCTAPGCAARWGWRSARHRRPFTDLAGGLIAGVLAAASYYGFVFIPGFRRYAIRRGVGGAVDPVRVLKARSCAAGDRRDRAGLVAAQRRARRSTT